MFGMGDLNFVMNNASFFVFAFAVVAFYLLRETIARCMILCRRHKWARNIGVAANVEMVMSSTMNALLKLFIESYFEICLALSMGLYSFSLFSISSFWDARDDKMSTILTIIFAFFVIFVPFKGLYSIFTNFKVLKYQA